MIHSTEPLFEQFLASVSSTRNESFVFIQKREKTTNQREYKIVIIKSKIQTDFSDTKSFLNIPVFTKCHKCQKSSDSPVRVESGTQASQINDIHRSWSINYGP